MSELRLNKVTDKDTEKGVNVDALHYQNTQLVRNLGQWQPGLVFENKTDYSTFNDQAIVAREGTPLPYTTQSSDPTVAPDAGIVVPFVEVQASNLATVREDLLGPGTQLYMGDDGESVKVGDTIPEGTTHLRVDVGGSPALVAMSPVASGSVTALSDTSATVGGVSISYDNGGSFSAFIYNDENAGTTNTQLFVSAVNSGREILIRDDVFFAVNSPLVEESVKLTSENGALITFTSGGTFLRLKNHLSIESSGCRFKAETGDVVRVVDYESPDGKLNIVKHTNFEIEGSVELINLSTNNNLNPENVDFGVDYVEVDTGNTTNRTEPIVRLSSTPYKKVSVLSVEGYNDKNLMVSLPVQNFHPYYFECQKAMQNLEVDGLTVKNERGFFAQADGAFYAGLVLWEGNRASVDNTLMQGVVTSDGTSVYDFYMAGLQAETNNCRVIDSWAFNAVSNTPLKIKKCKDVQAYGKRSTFSEDFFTYYEQEQGLLLEQSSGDPFTIDLVEVSADSYTIDNCHLVVPWCSRDGTHKATQPINNFSLTNSEVFVLGGTGAPYLAVPRWDEESSKNKTIIVTNNNIVVNSSSKFYLAKIEINQGTPDGGIIDIAENDIRARSGINEVLITSGDVNNRDISLDYLRVANRTYTEGEYQQLKNFCKQTYVQNTNYDGSVVQINSNNSEFVFFGTNPMGDKASSGSYRFAKTTPQEKLYAIGFHRPQVSQSQQSRVFLKGDVQYDYVFRQFATSFVILPDLTSNTIDITIPVLEGGVQTYTWDGSAAYEIPLDIGLPTTEPFIVRVERREDWMAVYLGFKTGEVPPNASISWEYTSV